MRILTRKNTAIAMLGFALMQLSYAVAAEKLSISPINASQLSRSSLQFTALLNGQDVRDRVQWASSSTDVAVINSRGVARLLSPGTTIITARLGEGVQRASTTLRVTTAANPVFIVQPMDTSVSTVIDPSGGVQVKLLDNLGGPLPGQSITLSIGTNPPTLATPSYGSGTLSGTLTQTTNASGVATFADLKIDWLGNGYILLARANPISGPVSGTSAPFNELRVGDACLGPDQPACSSGCADADLDGLNDAWEIAGGVDLNGDGNITDPVHDVLLPGADPKVPDIYLKYDYMVATTTSSLGVPPHSHQPPDRAWDQMKAMFAAHGIVLHVLAPSGGVPEHQVTTLDPNAQPACAGTDFVTMQQLRAQYFGNLRPAYHYMVFAHDSSTPADGTLVHNCPTDPLCGGVTLATGTGVADVLGDDAIISFGHNVDSNAQIGIELWTGTMMHELGHNFGLVHGSLADPGDATQKCMINKPNYISVMNYTYQLGGIIPNGIPGAPITGISCSTDADCGPPKITSGRCSTMNACFCTDDGGPGNNFCYRPDYAEDNLLNLNETTLDENVGVGGPPRLDDIVFYWNAGSTLFGPSNGSPIDWNNDGFINNLTGCIPAGFPPSFVLPFCPDVDDNATDTDRMDTTADWTQVNGRFVNLNFQFQCTAGYLNDVAGAPTPQPAPLSVVLSPSLSNKPSELSFDWARQHHQLHPPRPVVISISPGCSSEAKPIAAGQAATVRVAVLGTDNFDVSLVDTESLNFHGAKPLNISVEDVNGDGKADLVAVFDASLVKVHARASVARLTGWLKNSQAFYGEDRIRVVPNLSLEEVGCR
ncbi:MAG TPA: Ig-like domain-containing protein [Candidatus Angelobacter sp.]|nr:Ig-like domain-containing protein [Candidatus Angelobacter sp.]